MAKSLDLATFKAFAGNNSNVAKMVISVFDRVGNIVEYGENAGFSPFPTMFSSGFFPRVI